MAETIPITSLYFMLAALLLFLVAHWVPRPADLPRRSYAVLMVGGLVGLCGLIWLLAHWWAGRVPPVLPTVAGIVGIVLLAPLAFGALPGRAQDGVVATPDRHASLDFYRLLAPLLIYALACWSVTALLAIWAGMSLDARFLWWALLLAPAACTTAFSQSRPLWHGVFILLCLEWLYAAGCWGLVASWATLIPGSGSAAGLAWVLLACGASWLLWTFLTGIMRIGERPARAVVADALATASRDGRAWLVSMPSAAARLLRRVGKVLVLVGIAGGRAILGLPLALAAGLGRVARAFWSGVVGAGMLLGRAARRTPGLLLTIVRRLAAVLAAGVSILERGTLGLAALAWRSLPRLARAVEAAARTSGRAALAMLKWFSALLPAGWRLLGRLVPALMMLVTVAWRAIRALPRRLGRGLRRSARVFWLVVLASARAGRTTARWLVVALQALGSGLERFARAALRWLAYAIPVVGKGFGRMARAILSWLAHAILVLGAGVGRAAWAFLQRLAATAEATWRSLPRLASSLVAGTVTLVEALGRAARALPSLFWRGLRWLALLLLGVILGLGSATRALLLLIPKIPVVVARLLLGLAKGLVAFAVWLWNGLAASAALAARLLRRLGSAPSALFRRREHAVRSSAAAEGRVRASLSWALAILAMLAIVVAADRLVRNRQPQLRIVAGSGFSSFEPILKRWGQQNKVDVQISYRGSLDIMLMLEDGSIDYDAIWEGDSLWTSLGDKQHLVQKSQSIMCSPIVLGVKRSLAQQLGWIGRDVGMQKILEATESRRLRVLMTSATQSNSGVSAYLGFLYAFAGQPEVLTAEHLQDPAVRDKVKRTLASINRTSESSGWMRDLFLRRYDRYDAMFNYESHVLEMNQKLVERGDEPLYIVYPVEGLGMADFPFSLVRSTKTTDAAKELAFQKLQDYLRSPSVQAEIAAKGRRVGPLCDEVDPAIFRPEWGAESHRIVNSLTYPNEAVIRQALALYQTDFRKPSFTVFALDFSGSMQGKGKQELTKAMRTLLDQETAARYLLQASPNDVTAVVVFDDELMNDPATDGWIVRGNDRAALGALLDEIERQPVGHFTNIYLPVQRALQLIQAEGAENAFPAIILLTDGQSNRGSLEDVRSALVSTGLEDVPVYGITFGEADVNQLDAIAELTAGRVFDGSKDLVGAFRKAKGQN